MAQLFAEHNRHEVQAFAYKEDIHQPEPFETAKAFLKFLQVPEDRLPSKRPSAPKFNFGSFLEAANLVSQSIKEKHFAQSDPLVWKNTGQKPHRGPVADATCKPDITVAFEKDFDGDNTTLWPCIQLAGERVSQGKSREDHEKQAISYLHYLLLVRPDLYVAQGILTSENDVMFLLGIGGFGIRSFTIDWTSKKLYKLMYAFIYRLYEPGDFVDRSYKKMEPDHTRDFVTYTVGIATTTETEGDGAVEVEVDCPDLVPIYASNPFETRTHVLSSPHSTFMVNGRVLSVLKDQFCRLGTQFNEQDILNRIHTPEKVPGVVEMVYHKMMDLPYLEELDVQVRRGKNRIGVRQLGTPFKSISTLQEMLRTVFDLLEAIVFCAHKLAVLRFLRVERQVLHRDISIGNVMFIKPTTPTDIVETAVEKAPLKFVKYILGESDDPQETSVLLVDFNHAEDLSIDQGAEHGGAILIGTPIFIARAVERGAAYPFPEDGTILPAIPHIPDCYASNHPDRRKKFPIEEKKVLLEPSADSSGRPWRHELNHDAESVFWLLLYWSMVVQPEGYPAEFLKANSWASILGTPDERHFFLIVSLVNRPPERPRGIIHSFYHPLLRLLHDLAKILYVDRFWLDNNDTRNDPEYIAEGFQRLILQFLIENRNKDFMKCQVSGQLREVEEIPQMQRPPCTCATCQPENAEKSRKRLSADSREDEQREPKRNRLDPTASEMVPEDDPDEDEDISEESDDSSEDEELDDSSEDDE
ncbi:hypothetical protein FRC04_011403 [Tulasnella sp. 424]|nr:hypothetical protein FRC04_011403 [Tulasnella sp. 424]KAG8972633.1 hypothetical protein FRC05_009743 [Tulasnella sp. 425]